jgi:hypothetical protein
MAIKNCIFQENKICDDCGDCNTCDLDQSKICNDCGKCLGGEKEYASKAVEIDEIIEDDNVEDMEFDSDMTESGEEAGEDEDFEEELEVEFIDDIEGLRELLDNKAYADKYTMEEFPGFIKFKKKEN